jgi:hypothetical protein
MVAGDDALDSVSLPALDASKAAYYISKSGAPGNPIALIAYPART